MLVVHRLAAGTYRYYLDAVGPSRSDAPALGEAPGRWAGAGAVGRGLEGDVDAPALRALLPTGKGRLPGLDLTFAAPKSVSVLHGLAPDAIAASVRAAHDRAVVAGLRYLERHGSIVRVDGRPVRAGGLVAACFRHRTSRASDPHLHTHVVVPNLAPTADGRWRALHTPTIHAERRGAAAMYHGVLRSELSAVLDVHWTAPLAGRADVVEVPPGVRAMFSTRRVAVLAAAGESVRERRWSERVTRPERDGLVDMAALRGVWRERAAAVGWEPVGWEPVGARRSAARVPVVPDVAPVPVRDQWTRADVVVALVDRLVDGASEEAIEAAAERALGSPGVVMTAEAGWRYAGERFTTVAAVARGDRARAAFPTAARIDGAPEAIDAMRRHLGETGHRLVVACRETVAARAVEARTGAPAVTVTEAAAAVRRLGLGPGDLIVVQHLARAQSADLDALVDAAAVGRVSLVAAGPSRASADPARAIGPVATIDACDGRVTAAGRADLAAATAVNDWAAVRAEGVPAVLVCEAGEVEAINQRARAALRTLGALGRVEVGGFAVGDDVRFGASRPAVGVRKGAVATVVSVDRSGGRVVVAGRDGSRVELAASQLGSVTHAHAVPPVPALIAGRGDVFVIGGRAVGQRHREGHALHHYVTVAVAGPTGCPPAADRLASLAALRRGVGPARLPEQDADARRVEAWRSEAASRWRDAMARGDVIAQRAWAAQVAAARDQAAVVQRDSVVEAPARRASRSDSREALRVQADLAVGALVWAVESRRLDARIGRALGPPPADPQQRERWRAAVAAIVAEREPRVVGRDRERQPAGRIVGHEIHLGR